MMLCGCTVNLLWRWSQSCSIYVLVRDAEEVALLDRELLGRQRDFFHVFHHFIKTLRLLRA